jgi:hypothetical protein
VREVHDEAAIGRQVAERVQAAREVARVAQVVEGDFPHAGHDPHVEHDILAVGDLDADLAEARARYAHEERHDVHRAALHRAAVELGQLLLGFVGRHPVVVGTSLDLLGRADEGQVLGARHVVAGAAVQIAPGHLLLIELDQLTGRDRFARDSGALVLRAITPDDAIRSNELLDFTDPSFDRGVLHGHLVLLDSSSKQYRRTSAPNLAPSQAPRASARIMRTKKKRPVGRFLSFYRAAVRPARRLSAGQT